MKTSYFHIQALPKKYIGKLPVADEVALPIPIKPKALAYMPVYENTKFSPLDIPVVINSVYIVHIAHILHSQIGQRFVIKSPP